MTLWELAAASVAMAAGGMVQGSAGFGLNLIAAPVLAIIDPDLVPGPALVAAMVLTVLMTRREWHAIELRGLQWAIVGRIPGTLLAAVTVATLPERGLAITLALLVLAAVAMSLTRWRPETTVPALVSAGAVSGFMGTTTSIGGPPIALLYQRQPGPTIRATLSGYFALGTVMSIATLAAAGEFGWKECRASAALVPGLLIGFAVSRRTAALVDQGSARATVLVISAASAVALLVQQWL